MERRSHPIVYVTDVDRSVAFYADQLGFEPFYRQPPDGAADYVGLRLGESRLGIVTAEAPRHLFGAEIGDAPRFELWVVVEDVDATVGRLRERGVPVLREPEDMPWGERLGYVADPDGNPVALAASRSSATAAAPSGGNTG
jgi:lactoylglutathione lyase